MTLTKKHNATDLRPLSCERLAGKFLLTFRSDAGEIVSVELGTDGLLRTVNLAMGAINAGLGAKDLGAF
jgi:hypothetical protein